MVYGRCGLGWVRRPRGARMRKQAVVHLLRGGRRDGRQVGHELPRGRRRGRHGPLDGEAGPERCHFAGGQKLRNQAANPKQFFRLSELIRVNSP